MYIDIEIAINFLLGLIGLANLLVTGYYFKLTWKLAYLRFGPEKYNGLTLAMCLERFSLALVFGWNTYQAWQGIFQIVEFEYNAIRLVTLLARTLFAFLLLVAIAYQDINMQTGNDQCKT